MTPDIGWSMWAMFVAGLLLKDDLSALILTLYHKVRP